MFVQAQTLGGLHWLKHGFSVRAGGRSTMYGGGALNLGFTAHDDPAHVAANRQRLLHAIAPAGDWQLIAAHQVHGDRIHLLHEPPPEAATPPVQADGLMTQQPGLMLGIQVADCVPVLLADRRLRVVAALHAGWRGTVAGIVAQAVERITREYGSRPQDVAAAIGPAIGPCCYVVGQELHDRFHAAFSYAGDLFTQSEAGLHLNLAEANRRQLRAAGVLANSTSVIAECTSCSRIDGRRKYFSHRAERGVTGRAMGLIGIAPPATP